VRTRLEVLVSGAAAATLLACREAPTAPVGVSLQLDRETYVAVPIDTAGRYAFRLVVQYHNGTSAPIYFARCTPSRTSPIYGIPTADGVSESGWAIAWACTTAPVLQFLPGAVRTDSLLIQGPNAYDGITHEPLGVLAGTFRLEYQTYQCAEDTPACSQAGPRVASAPFLVRLP
jgi:hypothetical protein